MTSSTLSLHRHTHAMVALIAVTAALSGCSTMDGMLGAVGLQRVPAAQQPAPPVKQGPRAGTESASWVGGYRGELPCNDCAGVEINLSLFRDSTYKLETRQLGNQQQQFSRQGSFNFNADETRIVLDANGRGRVFQILPGGRLRMMGPDGNPVTGPDAGRYILRKVH